MEQWYKIWYITYKEPFVGKKSKESITSIFNNHILPKFKNIKLKEIETRQIQTFLNNYKKSRVKELISLYFNAMLEKAVKTRILKYNSFDGIIKEQRIKNIRKALSLEEQKELLNFLKTNDNKLYMLTLFYLLTGVRRNEALEVKESDINNQKINIRGTKTTNSIRVIPITQEFEKLLKNFFKNNSFDYTPNYISKKYKEILDHLNIKACVHSLRHTYATNLFYLDVNIKYVQKWLGHSSIKITSDIYTNLEEDKPNIEELKSLYNNYYYIP